MTHCVLLNADYSFLNLINWKRAMCLIAKDKVKILSYSDAIVRSGQGYSLQIPSVMRLVKLVKTLYKIKTPFNKKNVITRDGSQCAYCGKKKQSLTIDHIIPRSRGGDTSFENCVASCKSCNYKKGNRTPKEAGMKLYARPYHPTISEFLRLKAKRFGVIESLAHLGIY